MKDSDLSRVMEAYESLDDALWNLDEVRSDYEDMLTSDLCEKIECLISDIRNIQEQLCAEAKVSPDEVGRLLAIKQCVGGDR